MNTFTVRIDTSNAAFTCDGFASPHAETARILRAIADQLDAGRNEGSAVDANGNKVGMWSFGTC